MARLTRGSVSSVSDTPAMPKSSFAAAIRSEISSSNASVQTRSDSFTFSSIAMVHHSLLTGGFKCYLDKCLGIFQTGIKQGITANNSVEGLGFLLVGDVQFLKVICK